MTTLLVIILIAILVVTAIGFAAIGLPWWLPFAIVVGFVALYFIGVAFAALFIGGGE